MFFAGIPRSEEDQKKDDEAQMRYLKDWKNKKKKQPLKVVGKTRKIYHTPSVGKPAEGFFYLREKR